ncbi:retrovirus-related pol polyprotein from transposon TNT 1-94, partial [Tanacetum coccineum]
SSKGKFADVECYHCHKKGHTMKFCRQLKKENKKKNYNNQKNKHKKDDDGDDSTEVNTTTNEFFVCSDYDMVNLAHDDSSWILDSGATCHVATRKEYFSSYTPGDFGVVRMDNTGLSRIAGIGDICFKFDTGMELVLHNVKHVPDMRLNIISIGLLDEDGYHNSSGKQTRRAFKSRPSFRTENILDLVHFDVCGPMNTKTLGGCSYFVTFIDDYLRKVWVYTLKTKDQVLDVFKQFHALVERQTGKKLKCIRSDNGGFGAAKMFHTVIYEFLDARHLCIFPKMKDQSLMLYDPIQKKLVRSRDVVFEEDLTLKDVEKAEREAIPQHNDDLIDLDPVPPKHFNSQFGDDIQNDEEHDEEQGADDVDAQEQPNLDEDVHLELP